MKQTGFLFKVKPTDYILGASPIEPAEINSSGDWRDFTPSEEKQYDIGFDTFSCTTFSALNVIETWVNFFLKNNKLSASQLTTLTLLGFIENGKFNASDRFTAIASGTMPNGNYFQNVWDSIRKDGILPDKDFPFGGNNWNEYHNKTLLTQYLRDKAKKVLDIFDFSYEWVSLAPNDNLIKKTLKQAPIQGAIPAKATHAVEIVRRNYFFDSYPPYLRKKREVVQYSLKGVVTIKKEEENIMYQYFSPTEVAKWKLQPALWALLDKMRSVAGTPFVITSGLRTTQQNQNVGGKPNSAHLRGLAADLLCVDNTKRSKMLRGITTYETECFIEVAKKHLHIDIDSAIHALGQTIVENDD